MIISYCSTHYIGMCRWGRRFRLPTPYVYPQTASPLASGYRAGDFSFCNLAVGGIFAEESVYPEVGRRKRLPHAYSRAVIRGSRPRDGQSWFSGRFGYGIRESGESCSRRDPVWRNRAALLSATRLGDHAQSCARFVATQYANSCDHALAEGFYREAGQSDSRPDRRGVLAR
jgi:hypothetical protein